MKLDEAQQNKVRGWIADGLKLSEIQGKLGSELGLNLTYMEVRFLIDDLKLKPKDVEPPAAPSLAAAPSPAATSPAPDGTAPAAQPTPEPGGPAGSVSLKVDAIARPGTLVSGSVTFSDGQTGEWYLDQMGRLGVAPKTKGYKPSQQDVMDFQMALQSELARLGYA